jgi:GH25 family lysozyme M1 (1,4-beta-N-acetylmuramidase)
VIGVGWHFLPDGEDDQAPPLGVSTCLDLAVTAAMRSAEVLIRPYFTGRPDPAELAARLAEPPFAGRRVQLANEPNLPQEGFGGGPADYAAWFVAVADRAPADARLYYAGMSPGPADWRDWYTDPAAAAAIARAAGICTHAYGTAKQMQEVVAFLAELYPQTPQWIGETNFGAGQAVDIDHWAGVEFAPFLDWCAAVPQVEAVCYFAYRWATPDMALPTPVDGAGTAVESVLHDWRAPANPTPGPELEGVDVSNHQRAVDWPRVRASGRAFAFCKATEDPDYRDAWFARNWTGARAAGLDVGAYCFARPSASSPAASVTLLQQQIAAAGGMRPGDLIALDLEDDRVPAGENLLQWAAEWLDLAERAIGVRPFLYSGSWYMDTHGLSDAALGRYPLWYASYQDIKPPPPRGWDRITVWQYTAHGAVPGIDGSADQNRFYGTPADLAELGYAGAAPPDPAPEPEPEPIDALRDRTWAVLDELQGLAEQWDAAGWPSAGSGILSGAEAIKSLVRAGKGER